MIFICLVIMVFDGRVSISLWKVGFSDLFLRVVCSVLVSVLLCLMLLSMVLIVIIWLDWCVVCMVIVRFSRWCVVRCWLVF